MHEPTAIQGEECCEPQEPCPQNEADEPCVGTFTMERCCCKLRSRTFHFNIGPRTEAQLLAFLQGTTSAWEGAGYVVNAHSVTDIGAGWLFSLTVAWYV